MKAPFEGHSGSLLPDLIRSSFVSVASFGLLFGLASSLLSHSLVPFSGPPPPRTANHGSPDKLPRHNVTDALSGTPLRRPRAGVAHLLLGAMGRAMRADERARG
jgi:hypothetical protein